MRETPAQTVFDGVSFPSLGQPAIIFGLERQQPVQQRTRWQHGLGTDRAAGQLYIQVCESGIQHSGHGLACLPCDDRFTAF